MSARLPGQRAHVQRACCRLWPPPAFAGSRRSCGGTRRPRPHPTAATSRCCSPRTPSPSSRRWATVARSWWATTGAPPPPTARRRSLPSASTRLVTIGAAHPGAVRGALAPRYERHKGIWHAYFFQMPYAEQVVAADDFDFLEQWWRDASPEFDPAPIIERVKATFRRAGCGDGGAQLLSPHVPPRKPRPGAPAPAGPDRRADDGADPRRCTAPAIGPAGSRRSRRWTICS